MAARKTLRGLKKFDFAIDKVSKPFYERYGVAFVKLLTDWEHIVGSTLGQFSRPKKLIFQQDKKHDGMLIVEVHNSSLATQMLFMEPIILEKIATYFGYKAVAKMKIIHHPIAVSLHALTQTARIKPKSEKIMTQALVEDVNTIEDPVLQEQLTKLYQMIE